MILSISSILSTRIYFYIKKKKVKYKLTSINISIADVQVTVGTPFYSWIYTLQSCDFDTFWAFDSSGANDQLINLIYNDVKSHFQKIIYRLDILFKTYPMIINFMWYDCDILLAAADPNFSQEGVGKGG